MKTQEEQQDGVVRAVLRNEITWIIFILGILWGALQGIVLPLQKVQIQIAQIQTEIQNESTKFQNIFDRLDNLENITTVSATKLSEHIKLIK